MSAVITLNDPFTLTIRMPAGEILLEDPMASWARLQEVQAQFDRCHEASPCEYTDAKMVERWRAAIEAKAKDTAGAEMRLNDTAIAKLALEVIPRWAADLGKPSAPSPTPTPQPGS